MTAVSPREVPHGAQLIDVREADEYQAGHAAGAVNIPLSQLSERTGEIDTDRAVYVICELGGRSAQACSFLEQRLNKDVFINVDGGTQAWKNAGLEMES